MAILSNAPIEIGSQLPTNSRLWDLRVFTERHTKLWGPGNIMIEEWPDKNVHSDDDAAKREGLSGAVGAAPQVVAQLHRMMLQAFGAGWLRGGSISVKMIKPVRVDDFTTAKGHVTEILKQADGRHRAVCEVWVERLDETKVLVGTASAVFEPALVS